jgi:hypothetical protein
MHKLYATSALFALAVASVVWAQPPAKVEPPPVFKGQPPAKLEPPKKAVDPTDAAIAAALANDAAMKIARAKLQLAEAELAQAKQTVTLRVVTLKAQIDSLKPEHDAAQKRLNVAETAFKNGIADQTSLLEARVAYEKVNRALLTAEAEWKLLTGAGADPAVLKLTRAFELPDLISDLDTEQRRVFLFKQLLAQARAAESASGPVPERIRAALDKSVKLGAKGHSVSVKAALERFDLGIAVRGLDDLGNSNFETVGEELPVGAWLIYIQDTFGLTAHVREYGILFAKKENAPADAVTLAQFWKQKPTAEPAPKK